MRLIRQTISLLVCLIAFQAIHAVQMRRAPGSRIPEYILPTDRDNPALWSSPARTLTTRAAASGTYSVSDIPRTGAIEYPLILVDFKDRHFSIQDTLALLERYERMFNSRGFIDTVSYTHKGVTYSGITGSVSEYFSDQSYGKFTPKFKIIGPLHPSKESVYYGRGNDGKLVELIREICDSIIQYNPADLTGYIRNSRIDQLSIIYAGRGENYDGAETDAIWPQASELYNYRYGTVTINSIKYACTCELFWDSDSIPDGIGTFCHEFSHTLGLPDFYNTSSAQDSKSNAAMGFWSLMDYGNYENGGFSPVGYTAFEKYSLGWLELEEIGYAGYYSLHGIDSEPDSQSGEHVAYRLNTLSDNQFIILENHNKTGWYSHHAAEGMMVTAIDYTASRWKGNTVNNNRNAKCYYILPADNDYRRDTNSGDLFPYLNTDSITTLGSPTLKAGGSYPQYSIYNIRRENGIVSFYAGPYLPASIPGHKGEEISISMINGSLSVTAPTGSRLTIHDMSGKNVLEIITSSPSQQIELPDSGIWIVRCGNITRKVRN